MPPVSDRTGQGRGPLCLALPCCDVYGVRRLNAVAYAVCIALLTGLTSAAPGDALAAAGYGGGGAGGAGLNGGGSGGQGGGLSGGVGGAGGNALLGWPAGSGGNGGGDGISPGAQGGTWGIDGRASSDGAAGGSYGTQQGGLPGAGGGGGGVIGAGGGGGGGGNMLDLGNGNPGGDRGYTIILPGSVVTLGSMVGRAGSGSFGSGGGGGAGVTVLASGADVTIASLMTIAGGQGGDVYGYWNVGGINHANGGGGGGAGLVMPSGTLTVVGRVIGGAGGMSPFIAGSGGDAVVITSGSVRVKGQGQIVGGQGGSYLSIPTGDSGRTGDGGTGLSIGSGTVINEGLIVGGMSGDGRFNPAKPVGVEGAALRAGSATTVINKGTLSSGSDALVFEGSGNSLTLWQGSTTTGDVRFEGARNKLALGSDPGMPTAVVNMVGSLRFGTNGVYAVRATAAQADLLTVTRSATLTGATVQVLATPGAYAESTAYGILHAGGTFNGTRFAGVTSDLAYLAPTLSYSADDQDVNLTLTRKQVQPGTDPESPVQPKPGGGTPARPIRFADLVTGRNAVAAANAVDGMPTGNEIYRHALTLPNGAPQSFFSALSGESHANAIGALQGLGGQARSMAFSRLRANLGAGMRAGSPTAAMGASDAAPPSSALPASSAQPAWVELVGNWQRLGATSDTSEVRMHTGGIFAGADGAIGRGWRLGGALGYTDSNLRTDGVDGKTDIASYSAVVYGGKAFDAGAGQLNLLLGGAYTWHDINSKRRVAVGGLDQTLRADYGASTVQVFTELGWALKAGDALTLEPYAGLAWANLRSRAFQESGGSAALSGASQTNRTTTSTLGLRGRQALMLGSFQGNLSAGAGWRHAFGDVSPTSRVAFDAGDAFTVAGAPIARNAAVLEAGLDAKVGRSASIGLSYAGQFGSGNQDHSATLAWRWAF